MRLKVIKDVVTHDERTIGKTLCMRGDLEVLLNGEHKMLDTTFMMGKMMLCEVLNEELTEEERKLLSLWWYGCQFMGVEYELGVEFDVQEAIDNSIEE